jgi:hypothetical protein
MVHLNKRIGLSLAAGWLAAIGILAGFGATAPCLAGPGMASAQFASPVVDGVIAASEYGVHTDGQNQGASGGSIWYMTWDAANLYVGIAGANTGDGAVIYLDRDPQSPINGGTVANGANIGQAYDATNFAALPFRADLVLYVKSGYREYRTADGANGWSAATTGFGSYAAVGTTREVLLPWSAIGGRPPSFAWLGYVTSSGGSVYGPVPAENGGGAIGAAARYARYYIVSSTADGASTRPFSRNSYMFNSASDISGIGALSVWDFTMNTAGRTLTRSSGAGGAWTIAGNLRVDAGAVSFGSSTGATTVAGDLVIGPGAALALSSGSSGDLTVSGNWTVSGAFTPNSRKVTFNAGSGTQTVSGSTTFYNLTLSNSGASTNFGSSTVTIANALTASGGTMNGGASTIIFTGANGSMAGANAKNFYHLTIAGGANVANTSGGNVTVNGDFTEDGAFTQDAALTTTFGKAGTTTLAGAGNTTFGGVTVQAGTTLNAGAHSVTVAGNTWQVKSGGAFDGGTAAVTFGGTTAMAGTGSHQFNSLTIALGKTLNNAANNIPLSVKGNWINSGTYTAGTGTVTFNGAAGQTIGGANVFQNLTINNAGATDKVDASGSTALTVNGTLRIQDGVFVSKSDYTHVQIDPGAALELSGDVTVAGNWTNNGTFIPYGHKVTFDGAGIQTVGGSSVTGFHALALAGGSSLALAGDITASGAWTNDAAFDPNGHKVTFDGAGAQTIGGASATTFYDLEIGADATLDVGANPMFDATHTVRNLGKLSQTRDITDNSSWAFLNTGSGAYRGVEIDPKDSNAAYLGPTTVTIDGENACTQPPDIGASGGLINRCDTIVPTNTGLESAVTFWYASSGTGDESNGLALSDLEVLRAQASPQVWMNKTQSPRSSGTTGSFSYLVGATNVYTEGDAGRFALGKPGANLVTMAAFGAAPRPDGILVSWATLSEVDTAGFNVWRSQQADAGYVQVNAAFIPARGGPIWGASYEYLDTTAVRGARFYYKLESLDVYGRSEMLGPASAQAGSFALYLPMVR